MVRFSGFIVVQFDLILKHSLLAQFFQYLSLCLPGHFNSTHLFLQNPISLLPHIPLDRETNAGPLCSFSSKSKFVDCRICLDVTVEFVTRDLLIAPFWSGPKNIFLEFACDDVVCGSFRNNSNTVAPSLSKTNNL